MYKKNSIILYLILSMIIYIPKMINELYLELPVFELYHNTVQSIYYYLLIIPIFFGFLIIKKSINDQKFPRFLIFFTILYCFLWGYFYNRLADYYLVIIFDFNILLSMITFSLSLILAYLFSCFITQSNRSSYFHTEYFNQNLIE